MTLKTLTAVAVTLAIVLMSVQALSQIRVKTPPRSFSMEIKNKSSMREAIPSFSLPALNNEQEIEKANKAKRECASCKKEFYGRPLDVKIDLKKLGEMTDLKEGKLWRYEINSETAKGFQFSFEKFRIPPGATLHIYNPEQTKMLGAFTEQNNRKDGKFATQIFPSDHAVLEYFEPAKAKFQGSLVLNAVTHVFSSMFNKSDADRKSYFGESGSCNVNVNCPAGEGLADVKKAVGFITYFDPVAGMTAVCTGSLINSNATPNLRKPLFLTAAHCMVGESWNGYYYDYIIYFNYENSGCSNDPGDPILDADSFQGVYLRSKGDEAHLVATDYALLELYDQPEQYASVAYLGWDRRTVQSWGTFNISHPSGDAKKIAIDNQSPTSTNYILEGCVASDLQNWKVIWDQGVTEPGSSGSPLLNGTKKLIGILSGGTSRCSDSDGLFCGSTAAKSGPDWFPRIDYFWNHPNPGHSSLLYYLDPLNTNPEYLDAYFPPVVPDQPYVMIMDIRLSTNAFEKPNNKLIPTIETHGNTGTLSYSWSPAVDFSYPNLQEGVITFGTNPPPQLPVTRTYTLSVTPQNGLGASRSITVTLYDCKNKNFNKDACLNTDVQLGQPGSSQETYSWSPTTNLSNASIANPVFNSATPGAFVYKLTATSAGCSRTETYDIYVEDIPQPPSFNPGLVKQTLLANFNGTYGLLKCSDGGFLLSSLVSGTTPSTPRVVKLDANLNQLWSITPSWQNSSWIEIYNASDGGFYVTGGHMTDPSGSTYSPPHASVTKYNASGSEQWHFIEPVEYTGAFEGLIETPDGNFIAGSRGTPPGLDYTKACLIKFNSSGTVLWRTYTDHSDLTRLKIVRTSDGYYVGATLYAVFKYSETGSKQWWKNLESYTNANSIIAEGTGVVIAGWRGDGPGKPSDMLIRKMNATGGIVWEKRYGNLGGDWSDPVMKSDWADNIIKTSDEGYLVSGFTKSPAGGHVSEDPKGEEDIWIVKLDRYGNKSGDKRYGGTLTDRAYFATELNNGEYIVGGYSKSPAGGDKTSSATGAWILKLVDGAYDENPEVTKICQSFPSTFDNTATPIKDEIIYLGDPPLERGGPISFGCLVDPVINSGAKVYLRATNMIRIKNTVIQAGSTFSAKVGSFNFHPCETPGGRLATEGEEEEIITSAQPENASIEGVELYPNPSRGVVHLNLTLSATSDARITITNSFKEIQSEEILQTNVINKSYDLSSQASGLYIVTIQTDNEFIVKKIMLVK